MQILVKCSQYWLAAKDTLTEDFNSLTFQALLIDMRSNDCLWVL